MSRANCEVEAADHAQSDASEAEIEQNTGELHEEDLTGEHPAVAIGQEHEQGEYLEEDLLALADANRDGEVQHDEAVGFLGLGERSHEESLSLFQAQDLDSSEGLNEQEFSAALEAWGSGCATRHVSSYCVGATRHCCCHNSWGHYHSSSPYGSSGGGYHSGYHGSSG